MSQSTDTKSDSTEGSRQDAHQVPSASTTQAELAQAFRELARGEQQAAAIEANLTSLENKLDALLASIEAGSGAANVDTGRNDDLEEKQPREKN
ncbi:hypothetical protein F5Y19DRAFT_421730 [Xylariaceae sp. FL1651]|nr:hypothetical protein F5Y19DRAFT_421730 [Xylariaceae sp. FL1651]